MVRRAGREQSWNDYWAAEPSMQLSDEYDNIPLSYADGLDKVKQHKEQKN